MILVINPGSSSLKYSLFDQNLEVISSGRFSGIGEKIRNHDQAMNLLLPEIKNKIPEITKVGYRVVHGGDQGKDMMPITLPTIQIIRKFAELAPHHNPQAEKVIRFLLDKIPFAQHFAFFDSAFFSNLPERAKIYPIGKKIAAEFGIKRFGFHGISHGWILDQVDPIRNKKLISVHLGAGCSLAAIDCGRPIDTSMGFTTLEGLPMQTRSGDIDPGVILYLVEKIGSKKTRDLIENNSGLAGLSETSGAMLTLLSLANEKIEDLNFKIANDRSAKNANPDDAKLAIEIFCYRISKYIGAYAAALGGVDTVAFSGEIGFGSAVIRRKICKNLDFLNFKIAVVKPDEELAIARKLTQI
ncbi:MAG: acetate kinase [Candidatus Berkelbacteria bacterium]|nr:acetate kinase [Candidatus Berkelbacteria bacterium]